MRPKFEDIYNTLQGVLIPEARVSGVENAFADGTPCERCYSDMLDAYERLCVRLGVEDEDEDVEDIIRSFLEMQWILCEKMFYYGMHYDELGK